MVKSRGLMAEIPRHRIWHGHHTTGTDSRRAEGSAHGGASSSSVHTWWSRRLPLTTSTCVIVLVTLATLLLGVISTRLNVMTILLPSGLIST